MGWVTSVGGNWKQLDIVKEKSWLEGERTG
jgi:hypothetical protein